MHIIEKFSDVLIRMLILSKENLHISPDLSNVDKNRTEPYVHFGYYVNQILVSDSSIAELKRKAVKNWCDTLTFLTFVGTCLRLKRPTNSKLNIIYLCLQVEKDDTCHRFWFVLTIFFLIEQR
jgi:hypothetical protein